MAEIKFNVERVPARKDLLHFVEENLNRNIYEELAKNPERWIEELNIINIMLTRHPLVGGCDPVPFGFHGLQRLGENVFLYRGTENIRGRGLFLYYPDKQHNQWTQYRLNTNGTVRINQDFADIPVETFMPDNFEKKSRLVKDKKRPIHLFEIGRGSEKLEVYAKGSRVDISKLYDPPSWRLTNLSRVEKVSSKNEMDISLKLAKQGVKVPTILGYYESAAEEFLFLQKVGGKDPQEYFDTHREEIIMQDANMLAALCLLGLKKAGFSDFDDKIFDGKDLYLIDTEEIGDLYFPDRWDFREMLINPRDTTNLERFRDIQKAQFKKVLKDAIYRYQESLMPALNDKAAYISAFFEKVGWKKPSPKDIEELTTFSKRYQTLDSHIGMMFED
ncbi:hypothetical protein KY346_05800 [Candidatus Woesearchaeota archaeon]|nr:hypothetical protein [Candidatus Woesearchaeota archaeon]